MSFELFVAKRYLWAQRKGLFTWVTSLIGVCGVAVGVAALIATMSVMNGFQKDIRSKIIGAQSHIVVHGASSPEDAGALADKLAADPEVVAASPFSLGQAILHVKGRSTGLVLKGLDPAREFKTNDLQGALKEGEWADLEAKGGKPGLVLGEELARNVGVFPGDEVLLLSPEGAATAIGVLPRMKPFRVVGLLKTGYYEYDAGMGYALLTSAKDFFGGSAGYGVQLRLRSLDDAEPVASRLRSRLGFARPVRTFKDLNRTLFAALKLEKFVMFTIMGLIVLVAAFNIASTLILFTSEKLRDIGLLKAMGATPGRIRGIFWYEGMLIGSIGVGLGVALGIVVSWAIGRFQIVELPADVYYLSRVPVSIEAADVAKVALTSLLLCLVATVYPAYRAAKVNPVEAIHYG